MLDLFLFLNSIFVSNFLLNNLILNNNVVRNWDQLDLAHDLLDLHVGALYWYSLCKDVHKIIVECVHHFASSLVELRHSLRVEKFFEFDQVFVGQVAQVIC